MCPEVRAHVKRALGQKESWVCWDRGRRSSRKKVIAVLAMKSVPVSTGTDFMASTLPVSTGTGTSEEEMV